MNKKFLKALTLLLLVSLMTIGFTIAYFKDVEKSKNNVFKAGTLNLNLQKPEKNEANAIWKAENMAPGDEVEGELELKNSGTIPIESLQMEIEIEQIH